MAKFDENYFKVDDESQEFDIDSLIAKDEQKLWWGKPKKSAYIFSNFFKMLPFAVIWLLFDGFAIGMISANIRSIPVPVIIFLCVFFLLHLIPVWMWLYGIITANRRHKNLEYVFTDRRIIIKSGVVGIDIQNIYYTDIESVNVKVNWVDKMLKVGDIYIKSKDKAQVLWDIEKPYGITNRLQKIVLDIKTDINFPNDLRPKTNKGYRTKYTPEDDSDTDF